MTPFSISSIIILINLLVSYRGFKDRVFYNKYAFNVSAILAGKDYKRIITSGFLHVSWTHLIFNMIALYLFSTNLENYIGTLNFAIIYLAGLVGGDLLSLFIHRYHSDYSSVGASGAIFAVIFSTIALFPGIHIGFFLLPAIPGWVFGLVYVAVSIYGITSRTRNIGHDAHLGGGLAGMLVAIALYPEIITENAFTLAVIALPAIAFILFILYKPHALLIDNFFFKKHENLTLEDRYNVERQNRQQHLDSLLEKIHKQGINSLSRREKELLEEYSK